MNMENERKGFVSWIKYFCLNFFLNKYAREGAKRSALNTVLGVVIAFLLVCGGLAVGYNSSFNTHLNNAGQFRQFISSSLSGVGLSVENGKLTSSVTRETLSNENSPYRVNGYDLIIDTRPADGTYDDFSIICTDGDGKTIDYSEYATLSAEKKKEYSLTLKYSGKVLDTAEKTEEYRAYLDTVSDKNSDKYDEDIAKSYSQIKDKEATLSGDALYDEVYKLYAKAYYPSFENVEKYASVPTIRSYYLIEISSRNSGKSLILFDDYMYCSFITDKGVEISFSAAYPADGGIADFEVFLKNEFKSTSFVNFITFVADAFIYLLMWLIFMFALSFICTKLFKNCLGYANGTAGLFNIMGGFLPVSGIVAFIFGVALPYGVSVNGAYLAVRLIFAGVALIRLAVLIIMDNVISKRTAQTAGGVEEQIKPADPFDGIGGEGEQAVPADPFDGIGSGEGPHEKSE